MSSSCKHCSAPTSSRFRSGDGQECGEHFAEFHRDSSRDGPQAVLQRDVMGIVKT